MNARQGKILVAYFSHAGQNYANGKIIDLKQGHTKVAAEMAAAFTGAELFEIRTRQPYPFVYGECTEVAKKELRDNSRPELAEYKDVSGYDTLILGYPNWWGTLPMAVCSFLEGQNFAGLTILPFCTNEGSGMGVSEQALHKLCPGARIGRGLPIRGSAAAQSGPDIEQWLRDNR